MNMEDKLERIYEREMDALDKQFMSGSITQKEYDEECNALDKWINEEYKNLRNRF